MSGECLVDLVLQDKMYKKKLLKIIHKGNPKCRDSRFNKIIIIWF